MAILRGGKRIGGIDVRVGIPRDKDALFGRTDPRLKQKPGGNPESVIGKVLAAANEAEGFARNNKFYVEFNPPNALAKTVFNRFGTRFNPDDIAEVNEEEKGFTSIGTMRDYHLSHGRSVQMFCNKITIPDRKMTMTEVKHNGPPRKFVTDYTYADVTATFYADKFLRQRQYFELWQKCAYSDLTYNFNYYKDYIGTMNIFALGSYAGKQERDDITYAVGFTEVYPSSIGDISMDYSDGEITTFDVTFSYRKWTNYLINGQDPDTGRPDFREVVNKKDESGFLGGVIGKLPKFLQTPARGIIEDLSRRSPIGRITGGRVFPPFKIPPIRL